MLPRTSPPRVGKSLDDVQPLKKRMLRQPIFCDGDPPCGLADCSGCTTVFLEGLAPQIEDQLLSEIWLPFTLIWSVQLVAGAKLNRYTFAQYARALRDKFRKHGLHGIAIVAAFDIDREEYLDVDGRFIGYLWSIHIHGFMRADKKPAEIKRLFRKAFPASPKVKRPFLCHKAGSQRGWIEYIIKDPCQFGKRVHDPRVKRPYKRQLSNREAEPAMQFLAQQRVRDRLFLQGFQLQGRDRLVPIKDFGHWPDASAKAIDVPVLNGVTRVRTRIGSKGPKNGRK